MKFAAISCLLFFAVAAGAAPANDDSEELVASVFPVYRRLSANTRIVNGANAQKNAYPYQISLWWGITARTASHTCGGSLISEGWVVTAGHCFTELPKFGVHIVYAGKHDIKSTESSQQSSRISKSFVHPSYAGGVAPNDIALIKLASPFTLNDAVNTIALPAQDSVHTGNVVLSGWGSVSLTAFPSMPTILQTVTIPIVDTTSCYNALANIVASPPLDATSLANVCSGPLDDSRISACSGDSGGPLAQVVDGKSELVGVVSWGITPCGAVGAPSVYSRVSAFRSWIDEIVAAN